MVDIQKLIIQANKSRYKIPHLFQIDVELEKKLKEEEVIKDGFISTRCRRSPTFRICFE